ncbi:M1 family metallopeptidase [Streptomyces sp. SID13031]|uniref:M1 family aminopeptidase n=1 Tax=Streptomyces sp. SID13031 TaxID=2706046 RepID=UPI0013C54D17|nr:M1 family metallopeptidase [Streptomyces sp. SID13031]
MRRIFVLLFVLGLGAVGVAPSVAVGNVARGPGGAAYDVQLTSDATGRTWTGRERIAFTNTSGMPMAEVYLRLWGNGWDGCAQPVKVSNFSGGVPAGLSVNCTALKVKLPAALAAGKRTSIAFDLTMTAPERPDRFGRSGGYSFFGNALPVLAVRDAAGWHLEPDVGIGESYYALAADFVVRLDHPAAVQVPATGLTSTVRRGKQVSSVSIAKQVRDFAWAAGPFRQSVVTSPGGIKVRTWWTGAVTAGAVTDARTKGVAAIDDFGKRFGKYPYGEVDLVLNDQWGSFSGMEYPGFVLLIAPRAEEGPVVHELAHQWWYGIVGNNEYADPWLDEAFAVYSTDLHTGDTAEGCWPGTLDVSITNNMGYWKRYGAGWSRYVYTYGACMLHDLERVLGSPAMATMLRAYTKSHWYGVSTVADFKAAAQAATRTDLTAFWDAHSIN